MGRFVEGEDRLQSLLLPETLDDYVTEDFMRADRLNRAITPASPQGAVRRRRSGSFSSCSPKSQAKEPRSVRECKRRWRAT